uniref:Peptidase_M16_C domain-containing protein n=1 Tax=Parastrongyloides trichosuri TaxID=131310 RepID=A0A0N4ZCD2_PARTI
MNFFNNQNVFKWIFGTPQDSIEYTKIITNDELIYSTFYYEGISGKRFNSTLYSYLEEFKLEKSDSDYIDPIIDEIPKPVIVTAFSQNHFEEADNLIRSIRKFLPTHKVVIYDLGLEEASIDIIRKVCNVEYRKFNYSKYPPHVEDLMTYAWKPIILAETLRDFKAIWYADSSIRFTKSDLSQVYGLINCRRNHKKNHKKFEQEKMEKKNLNENVEVGNYKNSIKFNWKINVEHCHKAAFLLHGFSGHGILPASHIGMLKYLATNTKLMGSNKSRMYDANFIYAVKTYDTAYEILKWLLLCALEKECIAPNGSKVYNCYNLWDKKYSDISHSCHRFDQSAMNILLSNGNNYNPKNYISELNDFFVIKRGDVTTWDNTSFCQ